MDTMDTRFDAARALGARMLCAMLLVFGLLAPSLASAAAPPWERGESRGEDLEITLITFSPGDDVPSWFGHTAIGVRDLRLKRALIYNYGVFSLSGALVPQFMMGRLEFKVAPAHYEGTLRAYAKRDRDVRVATLALPADDKVEIAAFLADNVKPENATYLYHHYYDNCSTRIRDIINRSTDGQFEAAAKETPSSMTLRGHTRRHSTWRILEFGMSYLMGPEIDKDITVWESMFLPGELEAFARDFQYTNDAGEKVALFEKEVVYYKAKNRAPTPTEVQLLAPWLFLIGGLFGVIAIALRRWMDGAEGRRAPRVLFGLYQAALGFGVGGAGTIVALMWAFTDHTVVYGNHNVTLSSPLALAAGAAGLAIAFGSTRARGLIHRVWLVCAGLAVLGLLAKLVLDTHDNTLTFAMMLPVLVGALVSTRGLAKD